MTQLVSREAFESGTEQGPPSSDERTLEPGFAEKVEKHSQALTHTQNDIGTTRICHEAEDQYEQSTPTIYWTAQSGRGAGVCGDDGTGTEDEGDYPGLAEFWCTQIGSSRYPGIEYVDEGGRVVSAGHASPFVGSPTQHLPQEETDPWNEEENEDTLQDDKNVREVLRGNPLLTKIVTTTDNIETAELGDQDDWCSLLMEHWN